MALHDFWRCTTLAHPTCPACRFWDLATWHCVRKCEGHDDAVRVLSCTEDKVFSGSYDGSVGVW